jgi:Amt family ammonium transporter
MNNFDTGSTGFMLIASALVMLMTPGLAFFYGGLASKRNLVGIMFQSFVSLGITTIMWYVVGYSLCFSGGEGGIIGNLDKMFLHGVGPMSAFSGNPHIPEYVFIVYQLMFAIITPALITGAFKKRVTFKAYLIFLVLWQVLVYYPFAHMIWGGGWLAQWGVLDFAGGIVVHATAGFAALASVIYVGRRNVAQHTPNSIPLIAIGTGLLWFGWFGFNAGSELNVDSVTGLAFMNTHAAAAFAGITWMIIDWIREKKPKLVGFMTGAVGGLATVTPASGFVPLKGAIIIGVLSAIVCYGAVMFKNRMKWDDALDVWGVHGVGGALGTIMLGVFASHYVNPSVKMDGLWFGGTTFFLKQLAAVAIACVYGFVFTYGMLFLINLITPVRVKPEDEEIGLDVALHGEVAYDEGAL